MPSRKDCTPDAEIPVKMKAARKYSGPPKGSEEAKLRMQKVREAQWKKNGLVSGAPVANEPAPAPHGA